MNAVSKVPSGWPQNVLPLYLPRDWTAYYLGMSTKTLDGEVRRGRLPKPTYRGRRSYWYRPHLETCVAAIEGMSDSVQLDEQRLDRELEIGHG